MSNASPLTQPCRTHHVPVNVPCLPNGMTCARRHTAAREALAAVLAAGAPRRTP